MLEQLLQWDTNLLIAINQWNSAFGDIFMWNISSRFAWIPLYLVLIACLVRRYKKKSIWMILAIIACVGLADFISSGIIKGAVMRFRPTHEPTLEGILHIVNNYRSSLYGFVSSHAANTFSVALLFSLIWCDWRATLPLMMFAFLNCYSRMYLGVHYPLDILGGLVVGGFVSVIIYLILLKLHLIAKKKPAIPQAWDWSIMGIMILTLLVLAFPLGLIE